MKKSGLGESSNAIHLENDMVDMDSFSKQEDVNYSSNIDVYTPYILFLHTHRTKAICNNNRDNSNNDFDEDFLRMIENYCHLHSSFYPCMSLIEHHLQ